MKKIKCLLILLVMLLSSIKAFASANAPDQDKLKNQLQGAIQGKKFEIISKYLDEGGDVNIRIPQYNKCEAPLLLYVLADEQKEIALRMINSPGCDVNALSSDGVNSLLIAKTLGMKEIASLLQEKGASLPPATRLDGCYSYKDLKKLKFVVPLRYSKQLQTNLDLISVCPISEEELKNDPLAHYFTDGQFFYSRFMNHEFRVWQENPECSLGNLSFITLRGPGFESAPYLFTVWEKLADGKLKLKSILDQIMWASIGSAWIEEVHDMGDKGLLLLGLTFGADGGDVWGSFWLAQLCLPNKMTLLKEIKYANEVSKDFEEYLEVEYLNSFDPDRLHIEVREFIKRNRRYLKYDKEEKTEFTKKYNFDINKLISEASK